MKLKDDGTPCSHSLPLAVKASDFGNVKAKTGPLVEHLLGRIENINDVMERLCVEIPERLAADGVRSRLEFKLRCLAPSDIFDQPEAVSGEEAMRRTLRFAQGLVLAGHVHRHAIFGLKVAKHVPINVNQLMLRPTLLLGDLDDMIQGQAKSKPLSSLGLFKELEIRATLAEINESLFCRREPDLTAMQAYWSYCSFLREQLQRRSARQDGGAEGDEGDAEEQPIEEEGEGLPQSRSDVIQAFAARLTGELASYFLGVLRLRKDGPAWLRRYRLYDALRKSSDSSVLNMLQKILPDWREREEGQDREDDAAMQDAIFDDAADAAMQDSLF